MFLMATKYLFIEVPTQRLSDFENSRFESLSHLINQFAQNTDSFRNETSDKWVIESFVGIEWL